MKPSIYFCIGMLSVVLLSACSVETEKSPFLHPTWDINNDGMNDCESEGICDHTVDYSQPRVDAKITFVGMTVEEAESLASEQNIAFRVVMRDGQSLPMTMDYRPGRINATVESGMVVRAQIEGEPVSEEMYTAESWETIIAESCTSFSDGCNTCRRDPETGVVACTKKACMQYEKPYCMDEEQ